MRCAPITSCFMCLMASCSQLPAGVLSTPWTAWGVIGPPHASQLPTGGSLASHPGIHIVPSISDLTAFRHLGNEQSGSHFLLACHQHIGRPRVVLSALSCSQASITHIAAWTCYKAHCNLAWAAAPPQEFCSHGAHLQTGLSVNCLISTPSDPS